MDHIVGDTVHYVSYGTPGGEYSSQCRAAIISEIKDPDGDGYVPVSLCVLNPGGMFFNTDLPHAPLSDMAGGTWHSLCEHG